MKVKKFQRCVKMKLHAELTKNLRSLTAILYPLDMFTWYDSKCYFLQN